MFNKRKLFSIIAIIIIGISFCGCDFQSSSAPTKESVKLTFIQHSFRNNAEEGGYYFESDQIAISEFTYEKGFNLNKTEIDNLYTKVDYRVPQLFGDGYWSMTFFTKDFNEETGYSNDFLTEQVLNENMTIHFAIYG